MSVIRREILDQAIDKFRSTVCINTASLNLREKRILAQKIEFLGDLLASNVAHHIYLNDLDFQSPRSSKEPREINWVFYTPRPRPGLRKKGLRP